MSTVNIEKGYDYHIFKAQDGYEIFFTDKDKLFKITIKKDGIIQKEVVDYCEEKIPLIDGKFLKRVRDILTVKEE